MWPIGMISHGCICVFQEGVRAGEVCAGVHPGDVQGEGPEEDARPVPQDERQPDGPRSEAAHGSPGQASLHEDHQRAQDLRQQSLHGYATGNQLNVLVQIQ